MDFKFGIVYDDLGLIRFDLYFLDGSKPDFEQLRKMLDFYFELNGSTEDNNILSATGVSITSIFQSKNKIELICHDSIIYENLKIGLKDTKIKEPVYYIELEGFKMELSEITYKTKTRGGVKVQDFNDSDIDYTSALLIYSDNDLYSNGFEVMIYKHVETGNFIVDFTKNEQPNALSFELFSSFKNDFIYFLSLINGAEVKTRREYTGHSVAVGEVLFSKNYHLFFPEN